MPSARRYEEMERYVSEEKQRRGCSVCGTTEGRLIFARDEGYPDDHSVSYLMSHAISFHRLEAAMKHSTLYCQKCYQRAIGWKGERYRPYENYERCWDFDCQKKVRVQVGGRGWCKFHAKRAEAFLRSREEEN